MRKTFQCRYCSGTLRMCSRFEHEGVECWHCDGCGDNVLHDREGELSLLAMGVAPLEVALDKLRATQVRRGTLGIENDLKFILAQMEKTRHCVAEVLRRMNVPIVQEVKKPMSFTEQVVAKALKNRQELSLEGE